MKRAKFIMLAVIAALVLMGAGYAAWTQVFTINSTVSTGELFVQVKNTGNTYEVLDSDDNVTESGVLNTTNDYLNLAVNTTAIDEGTSRETLTQITYNLAKMYPGTRVISEITFENFGTLKAVTSYNNLVINPSSGNALWTDLEIKVNGSPIANGSNSSEKLENLALAISTAVGNLEPGTLKTVTIIQELPITSGNSTEDLSLTWTLPLTFSQYNLE